MSADATVLRTQRLVMRAPEPSDAEAITAFVSDWDVAAMTANIPHPYEIEDARQWIARGEPDRFVILLDDDLIGACTAVPVVDGGFEIGYWLGKPLWGRGYMTEAAAALIAHLRQRNPKERIFVGHLLFNSRSRRVIEKLGFIHIGNRAQVSVAVGRELAVACYELPLPNGPQS
jgi:RimJ/RimL family protein N-acetyltransferase